MSKILNFWRLVAVVLLSVTALRAETSEEFEQRLQQVVAGESVTIVHLWATWCPNCWFEHKNDGWKNFIEANPDVTVIFLSLWGSKPNDEAELAEYNLGGLSNFKIMRHPNQSRRETERVNSLLGVPISWLPSTWVFREGRMRYAVNYGEVRFPMLQQMVDDTTASW